MFVPFYHSYLICHVTLFKSFSIFTGWACWVAIWTASMSHSGSTECVAHAEKARSCNVKVIGNHIVFVCSWLNALD